METVLAIDDERSVRESYRLILEGKYHVALAASGAEAVAALDSRHVDLIILDLTLQGMSGFEFLRLLDQRGESAPVIVVTGSDSVEAAVQTMKHGACEFVVKPFDVHDLLHLVERTLNEARSQRELRFLRQEERAEFGNIIGDAPALLETLAQARQAMEVDVTVLITGETGTGKDLLARAIHFGGVRKEKPFVQLSCCAIPANLVESELFGLIRGAFTGATESRTGKLQVADGGTLFLDEIGEMPLEAQVKLLRVLQDGRFYPVGGNKEVEVDVRFICATNRDFDRAIAEGLFREDLYYRINVLPIEMPPLRKRREDIPKLAAHFLAKHAPRVAAAAKRFSARAMQQLSAAEWPGNVRELENAVERVLVINRDVETLDRQHLESVLRNGVNVQQSQSLAELEGLTLQEATQRLERHLISRALERNSHNQSKAAEELGATRRILKYKMDQLGIAGSA